MELIGSVNHLLPFLLLVGFSSFIRCCCSKIDIIAFEYQRKFGTSLDVGQCALQMTEFAPGVVITKECSLPRKPGNVRKLIRPLNDTRNLEIRQFNDIFVFMGLCSAQAASTLGLLYGGDCFAVEIASNLTFNKKTYIRAYVEYVRKGIDIQQDSASRIPSDLMEHYDGSYYLRDRSYGILEIMIVEMKFWRKQDVDILKAAHLESKQMSDHLEFARREVGSPYALKVIRLSTSEKKFIVTSFRRKEFGEALASVRRYENELFQIRNDMHYKLPHLNYGISPYIPMPRALSLRSGIAGDSDDTLTWETVSSIEIKINRALKLYKIMKRQCNRARLPDCSRLLTVKRELKNMKNIVHDKRSKWTSLSEEDQINTNKIYGGRVRRSQKELSKIRRKLKLWRVGLKNTSRSSKRKGRRGKRGKLRMLKWKRKSNQKS